MISEIMSLSSDSWVGSENPMVSGAKTAAAVPKDSFEYLHLAISCKCRRRNFNVALLANGSPVMILFNCFICRSLLEIRETPIKSFQDDVGIRGSLRSPKKLKIMPAGT